MGLLAASISMICFGFADSLWKVPSTAMGPARTIFFRNLFVLVVVIPYFLLSEPRNYIAPNAIWAAIVIGVVAYFGLYFLARATMTGLTSVVIPVTGANTLITLLLSIVTLEAQVNWISAGGITATIIGLVMLKINYRNGRLEFVLLKDNGLRYAMLAALFWGVSFAYSYYAVTFTGPALFTLILETVILITSFFHILLVERNMPYSSVNLRQSLPIIGTVAFLGGFGSIFNTIALDKASINSVTGIVALAPFISVVFGQAMYGEHLTRQQKWAVFLIITGIFVISYFRYY